MRTLRTFAHHLTNAILTIVIVAVAALAWLYLLEELGFGTWECWV